MKNLILSLVVLFVSFVGFSQTIVAEVNGWSEFECEFTEDYKTILNDPKLVFTRKQSGENKLSFDLDSKTYKFYFFENEYGKGKMTYTFENGVYVFVCQTVSMEAGTPMNLFVVINTNPLKPNEPYVIEFYSSTGKTFGGISYFE